MLERFKSKYTVTKREIVARTAIASFMLAPQVGAAIDAAVTTPTTCKPQAVERVMPTTLRTRQEATGTLTVKASRREVRVNLPCNPEKQTYFDGILPLEPLGVGLADVGVPLMVIGGIAFRRKAMESFSNTDRTWGKLVTPAQIALGTAAMTVAAYPGLIFGH